MVIDLTTLAADSVPVTADIAGTSLDVPAEDFAVIGAARFEGEVERDGADTYRLRGRLQARLALPCARCAEPFEFPVDTPVELRFVPGSAEKARPRAVAVGDDEEGGDEMGEDDPSIVIYDEPRIDLAQVAREQCYLAMPMKPLCRPDCQGLCPHCGTNRNASTCTCENRWEDPRLAGLKSLLKGADGTPPRE